MRVLVGGVGYRFQRDLSFGLFVSDALEESGLDPSSHAGGAGSRAAADAGAADSGPTTEVEVMDLGYGAIYVAQDLAGADPAYDRVVLVSAAVRGREPGLYERRPAPPTETVDEIQERVREAGAGVIDLDHLLVIGAHFDAFPPDLRLLELEPVDLDSGDALSPAAERLLPEAIARARAAALEPAVART